MTYHATGIIVWPPPPAAHRIDAEISGLAGEVRREREGDEYLTAAPTAADDPASLLGGGSSNDDAADDARAQYQRDQRANIPIARAASYVRAGLIVPVQDDGGAAGFHVTSTGYSVLPKDAQAAVASNPLAYRLDDEPLGTLSAKQTAPAGPRIAQPDPQDDTIDPQTARQS